MSMRRTAGIHILAICILLLSAGAQTQGDLQPAGLAVYTDTSRDIYVAALLTPDGALPAKLDSVTGPIAMEYRIATRRISTRGLSGTMLLQAELGSGRRAPDAVVDVLEKFKAAVQDSLLEGDQVQVGLTPEGETVLRLNGNELFRVADAQVFEYLLSGWVGESSSALLRDSLLAGTLDPGLSSQYAALAPSDKRIAQVATWTEEAAKAQAAADAEAEKAESEPVVPVSAPTIAAVKPELSVATLTPEKASAEESAKPAASTKANEQTPATGDVAASTPPPADAGKPAAAPAAKSKQVAKQSANSEKQADDLDDREYQRQVAQYLGKVISKVSSSVVYPRLAADRSWHGTVSLLVELDANGELLDIITDSPSGHKILDKAAIKAVHEASPFPKLSMVAQEEFSADNGRYQLPVPVRFKLN